jgi:hypothetical protein
LQTIFKKKTPQTHTAWQIVREFGETARNVTKNVIPDIRLAIEVGNAALATDMFQMIQEWVRIHDFPQRSRSDEMTSGI